MNWKPFLMVFFISAMALGPALGLVFTCCTDTLTYCSNEKTCYDSEVHSIHTGEKEPGCDGKGCNPFHICGHCFFVCTDLNQPLPISHIEGYTFPSTLITYFSVQTLFEVFHPPQWI
ncbi:MAG TPA: hypothetical protein PKC30_09970 [Saprospiraceae bacterium]|nr:hypothetical protein [Saprospiraceae bacterium]